MTIYALQKDASGTVTGLASWGNSTVVPEGYVACTADEYATAKQAFMNTIKDQAIGVLAQIQLTAALTVAMGGDVRSRNEGLCRGTSGDCGWDRYNQRVAAHAADLYCRIGASS